MNKDSLWSLLIAAAIGVAYSWAAIYFWGVLALKNPINEMLLDAFARQGEIVAYRVIISVHDVVVSVLLALPFAAVFCLFRVLRDWRHLAVAASAALIAIYGPMEWSSLPLLVRSWWFWLGVSTATLSLPAAFASLLRTRLGAAGVSEAGNAA